MNYQSEMTSSSSNNIKIEEQLKTFNVIKGRLISPELKKCCHSDVWVKAMLTARPFENVDALMAAATKFWNALSDQDKMYSTSLVACWLSLHLIARHSLAIQE